MMDLIFNLSSWHWLILGVILIGLESLAPIAYLMWFGCAAVLQGIITYVFTMDSMTQIVLYTVLCILVTVLGRRFVPINIKESDQKNMNRRQDSMIGKKITLTNAIVDGHTQVKIGDSVWNAQGPDAPVGTHMIVVAVEGVKLILEPI
jgi:membrane protein implicated in regulation of membrane protease activity